MSRKLIVFNDDDNANIIFKSDIDKTTTVYNDENVVIKLFEPGIQGPKGEKGDTGASGVSEPFYIINSNLYGVSASIAFTGYFSSSLLPIQTNSFDIGSQTHPWNNLYLSDSLIIHNTIINSHSIGFDTSILNRITADQYTFIIKSGSISASFNDYGVFLISNFTKSPIAALGGIIISGSDAYIGI